MKLISRFFIRFFQTTDKWLLGSALGVSLLSVLLLMGIADAGFALPRVYKVQIIAMAMGLVGVLILASLDYRHLAELWKFYLPPVVFLMVLTYFIGTTREGTDNTSWLNLGFVSIQPSEFLKIAFILSFALHLSKVKDDLNQPRVLALVLAHGAAPVLLILLQGDDGVALIMLGIILAMLFVAGFSRKLILIGLGAAAVAVPVVWNFFLSAYQKNRILVLFEASPDPLGDAYQQLRSKMAIGSGQLFGIGVFSDNHQYVPEMYNDFIFSFLGESLGFLGCFLLIVAYAVLCGRILYTALRCKNPLGKYICVGVFAMLALQIIVNISMCLMIMPVIGVTLPLMSAGGSSVLSVFAGLGLALCVYAETNKTMFTDS